jgi:hypothetical protein
MISRAISILVLATAALFAHCGSLDGPVVQAARQAIASGDVNLVLVWVPPDQESTIRQAFLRTMSVRTLNATAQELADTWFFETVVRVHRAGEGAPYEGLKPAGTAVSGAIRAADTAIATGDVQTLEKMLTAGVQQGLRERFSRVLQSKGYRPASVDGGRKYVAAYVDFIHFAERLEESLTIDREHTAGRVH